MPLHLILFALQAFPTGASMRRAVSQGAIRVNGVVLTDPNWRLEGEILIKVGKEKSHRLVVELLSFPGRPAKLGWLGFP